MKKKHTLIILSPGFAANEEDSTCLPAQQIFIKKLNEIFPSLQIIILAFQYPRIKKHYKWFGNDVISFNGGDRRRLWRILVWYRVYRTLKQLVKQRKIVGLLSFWCTECALIGKKISKEYNLKHLCWILGQDAKTRNTYVKRIKPDAGELIALSDFIEEAFLKNHGVKPAYVIPLGIDIHIFDKIFPEKTIDIMGAGSLIPLKQYDIFLKVIAEIKKNISSVKVVLCGTGPEKEKLQEMICMYELEENISLMGKQPYTTVLQLMQQSKVFLHPSSYEGMGMVCLEALCAGAHVVSFCKPMKQDIEQWHIVNTKKEMIQKILKILNDSNIRYNSVLPYSADDAGKRIMTLYGIGSE